MNVEHIRIPCPKVDEKIQSLLAEKLTADKKRRDAIDAELAKHRQSNEARINRAMQTSMTRE